MGEDKSISLLTLRDDIKGVDYSSSTKLLHLFQVAKSEDGRLFKTDILYLIVAIV